MRLIREKDLRAKDGLSRTGRMILVARGQYPRPVQAGTIIAWREDEVDDWIRKLPRAENYARALAKENG